ncbi:aldo/keto reductase [Sphingomonas bacterium]|uniref:aldo/keto reductase n=1 Tax=Sphingomonas bacterium TaxID=1895847 RepID=UPI0015754534|nr:aldo/keto reductase [Sphingomonas bacterium]
MTPAPIRRLGSSGLSIAPLVLGGNVFGWTADRAASFAVLDAFVAGGGTMIDTADVYSAWAPGNRGGESETIVGEWLRTSGKRDRVLIATKVGLLPGDGGEKLEPARIAAACDASLRRLGTDRIDLYFAHRDDPHTPLADTLGAFGRLVKAGKVRAIGASNYDVARLREARALSDAHGLPRFDVLQPEYNLVSRGFEDAERDFCVAGDVGVVTYSSIAAGFLTGKYRTRDDLERSVRGGRMGKVFDGKGPAVLAAMDDVADATGATLAQIALAWLLAKPGVTAPIASATGTGQLDDLLGAMTLTLGADQVAALDASGA